jgi:23S rRNA (guanosine2251-2'-O)-methyltransferase
MNILIYGWHACVAALKNPNRVIEQAYVSDEQMIDQFPILREVRCQIVERKNLNLRLPAGSVHQGIALQVKPLPVLSLHDLAENTQPNQRVLILDQVSDPHNVGAIIRSAHTFSVDAVIQMERNAPQETGALVKAACGAFEFVPRVVVSNLAQALRHLKEIGFWCYGLAESGTKELGKVDLSGKTALIVGSEGDGLRQLTKELCDEIVFLAANPIFSTLNVSNAASISLYTLYNAHFRDQVCSDSIKKVGHSAA